MFGVTGKCLSIDILTLLIYSDFPYLNVLPIWSSYILGYEPRLTFTLQIFHFDFFYLIVFLYVPKVLFILKPALMF